MNEQFLTAILLDMLLAQEGEPQWFIPSNVLDRHLTIEPWQLKTYHDAAHEGYVIKAVLAKDDRADTR